MVQPPYGDSDWFCWMCIRTYPGQCLTLADARAEHLMQPCVLPIGSARCPKVSICYFLPGSHFQTSFYRISTTFSLTSGWSRNGTIAWYLGINPFMPWQSYVGELQINLPINGEKTNRRQTHASLDMCHADTDKCRRFREHHQTGTRKQMGTRDKRIRLMPMQSNKCVLVHDENKTIALLPAGENRTKEDGDRWLMINAALSF